MSGVVVKLISRSLWMQRSVGQRCILRCGHRSHACYAGRRGLALTSSNKPSTSSGPVRYLPKLLPDPLTHRGRNLIDTRDADGWGSVEYDVSNDNSNGKASLDTRKENQKTSWQLQRQGGNSSNDPTAQSFFGIKSSSNRTKPKRMEVDEMDRTQIQPQLEAGFSQLTPGVVYQHEGSLVSDLFTVKTLSEEFPVGKRRRRSSKNDPSTSAKDYAITLLARGLQTETNLRSKLTRKNFPAQIIHETIIDLQKWGLQSDKEYADVFARSRWKDNTWGPSRIKYALLKKGVSKEIAEIAIVDLFQKCDETCDNQTGDSVVQWGMKAEAAEHLIAQARQRWSQGDTELNVRRRRMIGWLQRRGFGWTHISDILDTVMSKP